MEAVGFQPGYQWDTTLDTTPDQAVSSFSTVSGE